MNHAKSDAERGICGEVNDLPKHYLGAPPSESFYKNPEPVDGAAVRRKFDRRLKKRLASRRGNTGSGG